jgi:hypothetical protein
VSTYTLLTQALHANGNQQVLLGHLGDSMPGEEAVLFNQVPDGNGGQPLPANALFGEVVAGVLITPMTQMKQMGVKVVAPKSAIEEELPLASEVSDT